MATFDRLRERFPLGFYDTVRFAAGELSQKLFAGPGGLPAMLASDQTAKVIALQIEASFDHKDMALWRRRFEALSGYAFRLVVGEEQRLVKLAPEAVVEMHGHLSYTGVFGEPLNVAARQSYVVHVSAGNEVPPILYTEGAPGLVRVHLRGDLVRDLA